MHPKFDAFQSDPLASCLTLIVTNLEFTGKAGRHLLGFGSVTSDNLHDRCRTPKEVSCNTFVDLFFSCSSLVVDDPQLPGNFFSPSGSDTLKKYPTILNLLQLTFGKISDRGFIGLENPMFSKSHPFEVKFNFFLLQKVEPFEKNKDFFKPRIPRSENFKRKLCCL